MMQTFRKPSPIRRLLTATEQKVNELAQIALREPNGIVIHFDKDDYYTVDACRKDARLLQQNVSSFRSKMRQREIKAVLINNPGADPAVIDCEFDLLAAFLEETPNGWQVRIVRAEDIFSNLKITNADGEPLKELSPEYKRWKRIDKVLAHPKAKPTDEEVEFFWSYDREHAKRLWAEKKWDLPPFEEREANA